MAEQITIETAEPKALERRAAELANLTPSELLNLAVVQRADVEVLTKLMDLKERWEANEARKAFVVALNKFKASPPHIEKTKAVSYKPNTVAFHYAPLNEVCAIVTEALLKCGLTHRWETGSEDGGITVSCILTHELGHSERTTLRAPADTSGGKNGVQAIGSTVSYLERYTLLAATGLSVGDMDNDGNGKYADLSNALNSLASASDPAQLDDRFRKVFNAAKEIRDSKAMLDLVDARDKKRGEFHANR